MLVGPGLSALVGKLLSLFVVSRKNGPGWLTFNTLEFRKGDPVSFFGTMEQFSARSRSMAMM
jgi:hypothetical protein